MSRCAFYGVSVYDYYGSRGSRSCPCRKSLITEALRITTGILDIYGGIVMFFSNM